MSITQFSFTYPAYSALFRVMRDLIFVRDDFFFRVKRLEKERPEKDINLKKLKREIFNEIKVRFNNRIRYYGLLYPIIEDNELHNLEINKIVITSEQDDEKDQVSGMAELYPLTFVCDVCGDFKIVGIKHVDDFETECQVEGCNGRYRQLSLLRFCRECGKVEPYIYECKKDKDHPKRLFRPSKDSLYGWRFECKICGTSIDLFGFKCEHREKIGTNNIKISEKPPTGFDPLTIREGSIYQPVVRTLVNIEPVSTEGADLYEDEDYLLAVGYFLGSFDFLGDLNLKEIKKRIVSYRGLEEQLIPEKRSEIKESLKINEILEILNEIKKEMKNFGTKNIDEYLTIKEMTMKEGKSDDLIDHFVKNYEEYIESLKEVDDTEKKKLIETFNKLKKSIKIADVTYLPQIKLISAYIGYLKGPTPRDKTPHFEPIWNERTIREGKHFDPSERGFEAYIYPYETEGILIEFDTYKVAQWLFEDGFDNMRAESIKEARKKLLFLDDASEIDREIHKKVFTLLHIFSHSFIMNASKYAGLDTDSFGEIIFPSATSILIYSTSVINVGGLQYLFENSLVDLLEDLREHVRECIHDPVCINEEGACFACMYLPEYVCGYFNLDLDRREIKKFWQI